MQFFWQKTKESKYDQSHSKSDQEQVKATQMIEFKSKNDKQYIDGRQYESRLHMRKTHFQEKMVNVPFIRSER